MGIDVVVKDFIKNYYLVTYLPRKKLILFEDCNEGTICESALLSNHHNLNNLFCIIDFNHSTDRAVDLGNLKMKFDSFGWDVIEIDGHNHNEILNALTYSSTKPICVIANTIKGKGIPLIENNPEWHHKFPNSEEYKILTDYLK